MLIYPNCIQPHDDKWMYLANIGEEMWSNMCGLNNNNNNNNNNNSNKQICMRKYVQWLQKRWADSYSRVIRLELGLNVWRKRNDLIWFYSLVRILPLLKQSDIKNAFKTGETYGCH